jgi:hypothetical protein
MSSLSLSLSLSLYIYIYNSRIKYILALQITIFSPNGTTNYQNLDSGPSNYQLLVFLPLLSVCTVILDGKYTCAAHVTFKDKKFENALHFQPPNRSTRLAPPWSWPDSPATRNSSSAKLKTLDLAADDLDDRVETDSGSKCSLLMDKSR